MPYRMRRFTCAGCGLPVVRRRQADAKVHCTPCSIQRAADSARQLHAKSGPFYDRWKLANLIAAQRVLTSPTPGEWP